MRKKLSLLVVFIMMAALAIGGATYAVFTDTDSTEGNSFVAGTVDIDSNRVIDTIPGPMFYTTAEEGATYIQPPYNGLKPTGIWAPGDAHVRGLVVYNKGSLDAVLDTISSSVVNDDGDLSEAINIKVYKLLPLGPNGAPIVSAPGDDSLDQAALDQAVAEFNTFVSLPDPNWPWQFERIAAMLYRDLGQALLEAGVELAAVPLCEGPLEDYMGDGKDIDIFLKSTGSDMVDRGALLAFVAELPLTAGNKYQGAQGAFNFSVNATQAANQ